MEHEPPLTYHHECTRSLGLLPQIVQHLMPGPSQTQKQPLLVQTRSQSLVVIGLPLKGTGPKSLL